MQLLKFLAVISGLFLALVILVLFIKNLEFLGTELIRIIEIGQVVIGFGMIAVVAIVALIAVGFIIKGIWNACS